ncbi:MAG: hypothetical protein U1F43_28630 [Myxococcota bacterium]
MKTTSTLTIIAGACVALATATRPSAAQPAPTPAAGPGEIRLPLDAYQALEARLRELEKRASAVPIEAAVTSAAVTVDAALGVVNATVGVELMGDEQVAVPLLPAGTAVESATVDGQPLALVTRGSDLMWVAAERGRHSIELRYRVPRPTRDALDVPLPPAAAITFSASVPTQGGAIEVVPGEIGATEVIGDATQVTATLPRASWVRLAWGAATGERWLVTGGDYQGTVMKDTVRWKAALGVEVLGADMAVVPIAKSDVAIVEARLDNETAVIEARGDELLVRIHGRGKHVVTLTFDTRIASGQGPTGTTLWTPRPPALAVSLDLPGDKDVTVSPVGGVEKQKTGDRTKATVHLPSTDAVSLAWAEALPEDEAGLRANAEVFHTVRAADGVLQVTAHVLIEVTRGKAQSLVVALPQAALVNAVRGPGVSDWRSAEQRADGPRALTIYLDRDLAGSAVEGATPMPHYEIDYEVVVGNGAGTAAGAAPQPVPLATVEGMHRQRGMVALVRGDELEVQPADVTGLAAVGENQLPSWLRDQVQTKVTHTYKYAEPGGALTVRLAPFQRESARFDATVDTLFSLAEGVLRAAATIEVTVKAGTLAELDVILPPGINVLSASAPSLREHRVIEPVAGSDKPRRLNLSFTREMEGTVRIELAWERVLTPGDPSLTVPLVHVAGAVVEEGRLGLEALTAVEVKPTKSERLLPLDVQELPQKLVLRTSNPLLLAYHYVYADPAPELVLGVKRHAEIGVQVATIDHAAYETLWTKDGVVLTRARYTVRNRGKQFLRVALPAGSVVWSAELAGQPVKPARDEGDTVLVPLSSSAAPFEVSLVYVQRQGALGFAGRVDGELPIPDLVETETSWSVYLPDDLEWGSITTNMTVVARPDGEVSDVSASSFANAANQEMGSNGLRIEVPARGRRLVLQKLLANVTTDNGPSIERASFSIRYRGADAGLAGGVLVFAGTFALGLVVLRLTSGRKTARPVAAIGLTVSLAAAIVGFVVFGGDPLLALGAVAVIGIMALLRTLARRRASERLEPAPTT